MVENTRYEKGEEKNDPELAKKWAENIDIYVMDAFGSAHRAHASTYGIPEILKAQGKPVAIGYLVEKEVRNLTRCVDVKDSDRPYIAILGGFKVSDKIKVIDALLKKCDKILIGGAMAYTFAKALGRSIGKSPCEDDQLAYAKKCFEEAEGRILLPLDSVATDEFEGWTKKVVTDDANIPEGMEGMDIGPKTAALYQQEISKAKMVFWNGPMGVFEQRISQLAQLPSAKRSPNQKRLYGLRGGDPAAAVKEFGFSDAFPTFPPVAELLWK